MRPGHATAAGAGFIVRHAADPDLIMRLPEVKLVAVAWQRSEDIMIAVTAEGQLLEVVAAPRSVSCLAHFLDGGEQESDQNSNDGDDHQQLDERERPPVAART